MGPPGVDVRESHVRVFVRVCACALLVMVVVGWCVCV